MLDWIFEGHSDLGGKRDDPDHGRHLWSVHRCAGYRYDCDGGIFPLRSKRLHHHPVYGLGTALPCGDLADIPFLQRPAGETENPLTILARGAIFGFLIAYAKPIFSLALDIARAPLHGTHGLHTGSW